MSKIEDIKNIIERDSREAFPATSERHLSKTKGSPSYIRHQFIDTINNIKGIRDIYLSDRDKFKQLLDKVKKKYDDLYEEIENAIYEMEDRIYDMAKDDYASQQGLEDDPDHDPDDIDKGDIPEEMIAEFIPQEWHHNMENRYPWAKDYFPVSGSISVEDYNPIQDFIFKYVEPIESEIQQIYKEFINMEKNAKDNIRRNYQNIFNYIFKETPRLEWNYLRSNQ